MKWRIVENEWNLDAGPWHGSWGIEEDDPGQAVPSLVCWFYRGVSRETVQAVVDQHNAVVG